MKNGTVALLVVGGIALYLLTRQGGAGRSAWLGPGASVEAPIISKYGFQAEIGKEVVRSGAGIIERFLPGGVQAPREERAQTPRERAGLMGLNDYLSLQLTPYA